MPTDAKLHIKVEQVPANIAPNLGCLLHELCDAESLQHAKNIVEESIHFEAYLGSNHVAVHAVKCHIKDGIAEHRSSDRLILITNPNPARK